MKQAQTRTTQLLSLTFLVSALLSASSFANNPIELNDATADHARTASTGAEVFAQYGINEKLIKLSLSSLTAGEHLVEQTTRSIIVGDTERISRVFLVKETDTKGNIDLRIKYNPSEVDKRDDAIEEIERNTKTEYRLRDYVKSYDPDTVRVQRQPDETVIVSFNYSKYGLPQDIAYFRFMKVAITVKNHVPQKMVITNAKPFSYEGHQIDSYIQTIHFDQLDNGRVILSQKKIL